MSRSLVSQSLADWLAYQENLHPTTIDLGLSRLQTVLRRLEWQPPTCPVVTVGGTNGKGSCVALLTEVLAAGGHRVGTFTSPHLIRYNERICIAGRQISDASLVAAFERIERAREQVSLTFFEFNTLAALLIFETAGLDAIILEVGLGGRLDAVNVVDADIAIITSVALDHCDWLGNDVESIGREKAGIMRSDRPAIFAADAIPKSVIAEAKRMGARLIRLGVDYNVEVEKTAWNWSDSSTELRKLPLPALVGRTQIENAAAVVQALQLLSDRLPVARAALTLALESTQLPGRFQIMQIDGRNWIFDVAHNPAAAVNLATNLANFSVQGKTLGLCGMFADKDIAGVIEAMGASVDEWVVTTIEGTRALPGRALADVLAKNGAVIRHIAPNVDAACDFLRSTAATIDRVVVFGSFHTVGPALGWARDAVASTA